MNERTIISVHQSVNHILRYFYFYSQVMHVVEYHISISNSIFNFFFLVK